MSNGNGVRTFEDSQAVRSRVPLLIGLVGPSGSGKTFSALRLATGIQKVVGGDVYAIDTEARRMLHYAELFKFRHLPFGAPFSPLDYLAAIEHCAKKGAKVIIIDSTSHEHEGPGGVLEQHETEQHRLAKLWGTSLDAANLSAWGEPKKQRRQLINAVTQMDLNFIFCFRAKQKLRVVKGAKPEPRGWMPIAGEEFIYEMTLKCLLYPASDGVPMWSPKEDDEKELFKLPRQFRDVFANRDPLSEDIGMKLAEWAMGGAVPIDVKLAKNRASWLDYWTKKGVSVDRILAAAGKETVDDLRDFRPFEAIVAAIKAKKTTLADAFPFVSSGPPTDDDDAPAAEVEKTASAANGNGHGQAPTPKADATPAVDEHPDDAAARAAAAPRPGELGDDDDLPESMRGEKAQLEIGAHR